MITCTNCFSSDVEEYEEDDDCLEVHCLRCEYIMHLKREEKE